MNGNDPITERKRIASWWIRWNDLNWPNGDNHDKIKARAEAMAKANITTAMIFGTHFRWDYLPYFTLLHDYLATVSEELRACGVELWDHHSVNLVHRYDTREEMRHVMLHSGPHLPFSPSREAAATWEYKGKRLNDWRMLDVKTGEPLYYPQYASEGFCFRNPEFIEAYTDYVKTLISDTGITGLSADDPVHYMHYNSCACPYCRAELKRRAGIELPAYDDRSFWGNWANPAWNEWIDMRMDAAGYFAERVAEVIPEGFRLTTCGTNSASAHANAMGSDARSFLRGCNYANLEMSGNTPPYKKDSITVNTDISERLVSSSHHQASARENGYRCFATGFGFTEDTANIVWAVNKMLDSDCWFSTLKDRLGLPNHILDTLPNEWDIVGKAFGFEKENPELFEGVQAAQLGVYFSYETRKHSFFGGCSSGYHKDWCATLRALFKKGISPHTIFDFPTDTSKYPLVIVPSAYAMTEEENKALSAYMERGGVVIVTGPTAVNGCKCEVEYPSAPTLESPEKFFSKVVGVKHVAPEWKQTPFADSECCEWQKIGDRLYYSPSRMSEDRITDTFIELVRSYMKPLPIETLESDGYLTTIFESEDAYTVRMLAEFFDTDVDHKLDEMRFHRSRVNYINHVEPINVTQRIRLKYNKLPTVYTPFNSAPARVMISDGECVIELPEKTSFIIIQLPK